MYTITTRSESETLFLGKMLGGMLKPGDLVTLNGDLGAGKTCLARGVGSGLDVAGRVKSPSFALVNEYEGRIPLYHMDVYRLDNPAEIEDLGYEEYFYGTGATLVEWAERISSYLPEQRLDIMISKVPNDEDTRKITLSPRGERYEKMARELVENVCSGN